MFTEEAMLDFIKKEPLSEPYFKKWIGADEFLYNYYRYVLLVKDIPLNLIRKMPLVLERIESVREYRKASKSAPTRKLAETPTRFHVENFPTDNYIVIPEVTGGNRKYIPMGFLEPEIIPSNLVKVMPNANLFHFGILMSSVHMAWVKAVGSFMSTSYRYSVGVIYNNFPWPSPTREQIESIEKTSQMILDARKKYSKYSLADIYDPRVMPDELIKAHNANDKAVMEAYGLNVKTRFDRFKR